MPVAKATAKEIAEWNAKLAREGLGEELVGDDAHIVKYGFSISELEDLPTIDPIAHQSAVAENLTAYYKQTHISRTQKRAAVRREKSALKDRIWGRKSTT